MSGNIFCRVARVSDFSVRRLVHAEIAGWPVLIIRDGDDFHAFHNRCPHTGVRMNAARVHEHALVCPHHLAYFDLRSGQCRANPPSGGLDGLSPLTRYEIRLTDGWIEIEIEGAPSLGGQTRAEVRIGPQ
jgi:nitrite reductase/ring-hydroxylating ferredoxin subunit